MAEQCDEEGSEPRGIDTTARGRHQPRVRQCFGQPSSSGPQRGEQSSEIRALISQREVIKDVYR